MRDDRPIIDEEEIGTWQQVRTRCLSDGLGLRWVTATELSLRQRAGAYAPRDWAMDAELMKADRVHAIDKLRRDNAVLEKQVQTLQGLIQITKGRKCFGPQ